MISKTGRPRIDKAVIVEGKYDKIKLDSIFDATVIQTDGFRIFRDRQKVSLIRFYAEKTGIIVATDSDAAGFMIRNKLKGIADPDRITQVYLPSRKGREKRKHSPSAEGLLGLEGLSREEIISAFEKAGAIDNDTRPRRHVTRQQLYDDGLYGAADSAGKRERLLALMGLPKYLNVNGLIDVLDAAGYDEYRKLIDLL